MIDLLLDPDKALDAVNKAVALVKKAAKATGSSMGKAMEIELAIDAQKEVS